jgi:hypothetical protein
MFRQIAPRRAAHPASCLEPALAAGRRGARTLVRRVAEPCLPSGRGRGEASTLRDLPPAAKVTVTPLAAPYGTTIRVNRRSGINARLCINRILLDHYGRRSYDNRPANEHASLDYRSLNDYRRRLIFIRVNFALIGWTFAIAVRECRRGKSYGTHRAQDCSTHVTSFPMLVAL